MQKDIDERYRQGRMHRNIEDIPAISCDDLDMYPRVHDFDTQTILIQCALGYDAKMERQNKEPVITEHKNHKKVITLSKAQATCYEALVSMMKTSDNGKISRAIAEVVFRKATVDVLVREHVFVKDGVDLRLPIKEDIFDE